MNENISAQNSERLATLSVFFCLMNGIEPNAELAQILAQMVMANIAKWYVDRGRTDFNPSEELIADEAIQAAFERAQQIAVLASISAQTGIGMDL